MNHKRNLAVREARRALSLLICLLLVLGYMILHYLGGSSQAPPEEIRSGFVARPVTDPDETAAHDAQPQVLTIESSDAPPRSIQTSQRPDAPSRDEDNFDR